MLSVLKASEIIKGRIVGDESIVIKGVGSPATAAPDSVCFIEAEKYLESFRNSSSRIWIINQTLFDGLVTQNKDGRTFLLVDKPYNSFVKLVEHFFPAVKSKPGVHESATIYTDAEVHPTAQIEAGVVVQRGAKIGAGVILHPQVWVGEYTTIGDDSILYPGAKIYHHCVVGKRNIIHAGAVVGSDGFGFLQEGKGLVKIPQVGRAILHDDVEVGANSTIDRGTVEDTEIGAGTKIDNLVQIGHNAKIGKSCIFCAFVGVSGNTIIGNNVLLAGQVGTKGHMKIGDNVQVGAQSGVSKDVPSNSQVKGYPPQPLKEYLRLQALIQKLPEIYKRLVKLEEERSK